MLLSLPLLTKLASLRAHLLLAGLASVLLALSLLRSRGTVLLLATTVESGRGLLELGDAVGDGLRGAFYKSKVKISWELGSD